MKTWLFQKATVDNGQQHKQQTTANNNTNHQCKMTTAIAFTTDTINSNDNSDDNSTLTMNGGSTSKNSLVMTLFGATTNNNQHTHKSLPSPDTAETGFFKKHGNRISLKKTYFENHNNNNHDSNSMNQGRFSSRRSQKIMAFAQKQTNNFVVSPATSSPSSSISACSSLSFMSSGAKLYVKSLHRPHSYKKPISFLHNEENMDSNNTNIFNNYRNNNRTNSNNMNMNCKSILKRNPSLIKKRVRFEVRHYTVNGVKWNEMKWSVKLNLPPPLTSFLVGVRAVCRFTIHLFRQSS